MSAFRLARCLGSLTYRESLKGVFFIFSQLGENAFEAVRVDDRAISDGPSQVRQQLLVGPQQDVQATRPPIDL